MTLTSFTFHIPYKCRLSEALLIGKRITKSDRLIGNVVAAKRTEINGSQVWELTAEAELGLDVPEVSVSVRALPKEPSKTQ